MGDLFDEVMGVLSDVDSTSRPQNWIPDSEQLLSEFHRGSSLKSTLSAPPLERNQKKELQELDDFDRQVMNEPNVRNRDGWDFGNLDRDLVSLFPPHPRGSALYSSPRLPTIPLGEYRSRMYTVQGENSDSHQRISHPSVPVSRRKLDLSKFGFNPRTPQRANRPTSSSSLASSPIPYNLKHPYKPLAERQKGGSAEKNYPAWTITQKSQQRATIASENTIEYKTPIAQGIPLVSVNSIPDRFRGVFPFPLFNAVQSRCLHSVYSTNDNIVISSPTGSGKTAVMELAICALVNELNQGSYKVVYQAPTKALCAERKKDWDGKFRTLGLTCTELTGDTQQAQLRNVKEGDIIITTPEKWDSMTRRWDDHKKLLELVRLFLIDEVHILKESRGATLEVVVSRMKSIGTNVRFVALSATVPNSEDIAIWLGKNSACSSSPACEMRFGEEFRPVQLQKFVYGYQSTGNDFMFDKTLDKMLPDIIKKHSSGKPVMIFCMTRAMCVSTAKMLAEKWKMLQPHERYWPAPKIGFSFKDKELHTTGTCGVAFHHAGLDVSDRTLIERLFLEGCLQVICCTSTLAVGVNLPAYLVIIKNTVTWADGQTKDYADLEVMQMVGRAGRPQFDDSAVAVIMTKRENKMKYEKMVSGAEPLESCLNGNLVEHMNAEVGLGTITNVESAKTWLRSTFLYVRLKRNPAYYKFDQHGGPEDADRGLEEICEKNIDLLHQAGLLLKHEARLKCSELGDAMARYYIRFVTMQTILELEKKAGLPEVLLVLSQAQEFRDIRFRSGEKGLFKELNKLVKYPLNGELTNASHKAYILIQFEIGMMEFPVEANFQKFKATLMQDKSLIFQHCHRVIRCIIDCKLHFKDSVSVRSALEVARSLKARVWENSPLQLRQIEGFGPASVKKLVNAGIRSLGMLETLEAHKIETILSRNPPFGSKIIRAVRDIPKLQVVSRQVSKAGNGKDSVKLKVRAEIGYLNDKIPGKYRGMILFANFLAERSDGLLIDFRRIPIGKLEGGKDIQFMVELEHKEQTVICYLVCEDIVGTLKFHELKPDVESALYPGGECPALQSPPPNIKRTDMSRFITTRELCKTSGVGCLGTNTPASTDIGQTTRTTENLAVSEEKDLCFLNIDDFDMSDFDDSASQEAKENTDTNNVRTKTEIDLDGLESSGLETNEQLPNGNYVCRHRCGDKKKCKHFCCRDGLEKPPKPLKRKKSIPDAKSLQVPVPRKIDQQEIHSSKPKQKPRMSAITHMKNVDIEVLDLVGDESSTYERMGATTDLEKLKKLHSTSTLTTHRSLTSKPVFSCSNNGVAKPPFSGIEQPSLTNYKRVLSPAKESRSIRGRGFYLPQKPSAAHVNGSERGEQGDDMPPIAPTTGAGEACATPQPSGSPKRNISSNHKILFSKVLDNGGLKNTCLRRKSQLENGLTKNGGIESYVDSPTDNYPPSSSSTMCEELRVEDTEYNKIVPPDHDQQISTDTSVRMSSSEYHWKTNEVPSLIRKRGDTFGFPLRNQIKRRLISPHGPSDPDPTSLKANEMASTRKRTETEDFHEGEGSGETNCTDVLDFLGECVIYLK